jgi:hypothetical protein
LRNTELLSTVDVAVPCRVDGSTVRWWRRTNRLHPFVMTPRGQALYRRVDVERFLEARQRAAEALAGANDAA